MRKINLSQLFALLALCVAPQMTHAAIFDAPDYLEPGKFSIGVMGEYLMTNPDGEGAEIRVKRGINDMVNVQPFVGLGSGNRGFRFGAAMPISFFPDTDGQPGISLVISTEYIRRELYRGLHVSAAPILSKLVEGFDELPLNLFLSFPFHMDLYDSKYKTGWQLAFGALADVSESGAYFVSTELDISLKRSESAIVLGGGIRFSSSPEGQQAVWRNNRGKKKSTSQKIIGKVKSTISSDDDEVESEDND